MNDYMESFFTNFDSFTSQTLYNTDLDLFNILSDLPSFPTEEEEITLSFPHPNLIENSHERVNPSDSHSTSTKLFPKRPVDVFQEGLQGTVIGDDNGKWSTIHVDQVENYVSEVGRQYGTTFKKSGGKIYGAGSKDSSNENKRALLVWTQFYRCVGQRNDPSRCKAKIVVSVYKNNPSEALVREYHSHNHPLNFLET